MIIRSLTVGPLQENCHIVIDDATSHAVLVDPGDEADRILAEVATAGVTVDAIWLTHAHFDHLGAVAAIKRVHDVPVHLHPLDAPLYERADVSARTWGLTVEAPPPVDVDLADGDRLRVGTLEFTVMHTPGHAPGHVVFHNNGVVLAGDLLFAGSIGRTDLPLSNPAHMSASLDRVSALPDALVVYPGHGPDTTIGTELRTNPFLNGAARVVGG